MVDIVERLKAAARLRQARQRAGFREGKDAADYFGWPYNTYKAHENHRGPSREAAKQYAEGFRKHRATREVTAGWLLTGDNAPKWAAQEHAPPKQIAIRTVPKVTYSQATRLDKVRDVDSLGDRAIAIGDDRSLGLRIAALEIEGDSMIAVPPNGDVSFRPGDEIIVDPDAKYKPGDYVIAAAEGSDVAVFRKYRAGGKDGGGTPIIKLVPLNENYETITFNSDTPGRIIAKMVRHIRKF